MSINEPHRIASGSARKARDSFVTAICIFWIVASIIGFAVQAFAATPTGLRGSQSISPPAAKMNPPRPSPKAQAATTPQAWLGSSIWRAGPCDSAQNFQAFSFTSSPKVEVGSGKLGEGERLELLRVSTDPTGLIQVETRVCAPVGCNQTVERYKKLSANQMQEWHFEGRLPDHVPYVIVANGAAVDGSGPGRVFNRCAA
jgi:hypothetical protein